ncbi:MAG: TonB-dependent receptor, partial [Duncaniella sp.]|nr:TonB-dependent receptor [Duncaniella sp.]
TKEDWFRKSPLVNMLKFKASYGEQGNDAIGSYRYVDTYTIKNSNDEISFSFDDKGNPDITWEKVGNFNTGFEFEFFNSRLTGGIDYYYRKTSDMLMYFSAPYEIGYAGYYTNVGDIANQGIEVDLSGDIIATRNFRWNVGLNMTWEKNRVTYIPEESAGSNIDGHRGFVDGTNYVGEGLPMYTWYLKRFAGVGENGEALYYKKESNGDITTTEYFDEASYFLGESALPKLFGGFTTSFNIFDFDINAQFNYSIGGKKMDYGYMYLMTAPITGNTGAGIHRDVFKGWRADNPDSSLPMWYFNDTYAGSVTDQWLIDGSYLTFKNLSVGYNLPKKIAKNLHLAKLRVYGACENVAYWTKRKGFDPRGSFSRGSYGEYSPMRTISGGIQVEF